MRAFLYLVPKVGIEPGRQSKVFFTSPSVYQFNHFGYEVCNQYLLIFDQTIL